MFLINIIDIDICSIVYVVVVTGFASHDLRGFVFFRSIFLNFFKGNHKISNRIQWNQRKRGKKGKWNEMEMKYKAYFICLVYLFILYRILIYFALNSFDTNTETITRKKETITYFLKKNRMKTLKKKKPLIS